MSVESLTFAANSAFTGAAFGAGCGVLAAIGAMTTTSTLSSAVLALGAATSIGVAVKAFSEGMKTIGKAQSNEYAAVSKMAASAPVSNIS